MPVSYTHLDVYKRQDLETSLRNAPPLRIVMGAGGGATQSYDVVDINGNVIDTGSIVPGQDNALTISVPANPPAVPAAFDYQVTISGRPQAGDNFSVSFNTNGAVSYTHLSNVELSDQLVNLIVAQRNYQANAKTCLLYTSRCV